MFQVHEAEQPVNVVIRPNIYGRFAATKQESGLVWGIAYRSVGRFFCCRLLIKSIIHSIIPGWRFRRKLREGLAAGPVSWNFRNEASRGSLRLEDRGMGS